MPHPNRPSAHAGRRLRRAAALGLLALAGCAGTPEPVALPTSRSATSASIPTNWPLPPAEIERRIAGSAMEVRSIDGAGAGTTGALKVQLFFPETGDTLAFKWKTVPGGDVDGWNNAPRKELASYELQKRFLDPADYVVPTVGLRCLPLEAFRAHAVAASPSVKGTSCLLGAVSIWLQNVTLPTSVYEPSLFAANPDYATSVADLNLLTYLVEHQDGREGNFLISKNAADLRVFAIDNGISFGAVVHNFFVPNWDVIRVPAFRRASIERLRRVDRADLDRLGVLVELHADANGMLVPVRPGPNRDPEHGARVAPGWLQLGLTRSEIDHLEERLRELLARIDRGKLAQF